MMEYGVPNGVNSMRNEGERGEGGAGAQASDNERKQKPQVDTLLVAENKQTTVQVETILVPQCHTLREVYEGGGTETDQVGERGSTWRWSSGGARATEAH